MALSSISKIFSLSISLKPPKFSTLNSPTISSTEKFYTHLQRNGAKNIEKALTTVNATLDSNCVTLRFFIWAGLQSKYRHSSFMYSKACELLQINRNPGGVVDIVEGYRVDGKMVSAKAFKVVLNLCKEARLANEALWILRKMNEFGLQADTTAYNVVIRLFCEKGDMNMAEELMNEMGLSDLYPDMITYVAMIKGFCNLGRLEDACGLIKSMRGHGCVPNAVVYSTLLDGVCRCGSMERALELLGEMEREGGNCGPNKGQTMEALEILDRMEAFGCAPNRVTGHFEKAYKAIDKVVAGGNVSYGDCYSSLILSFVKFQKLEEAEKLIRKMLATGVKPDSLASSVLIRELCLEGRVLDGFYLFDEVEKFEFLTSIDSDLYPILLHVRLLLKKGIRLKASYIHSIAEHLKKFENEELVKQLSMIGK
ncbi:hypothetical protein ACJW30_08G064400 [Castanea mollissima]